MQDKEITVLKHSNRAFTNIQVRVRVVSVFLTAVMYT